MSINVNIYFISVKKNIICIQQVMPECFKFQCKKSKIIFDYDKITKII